MTRVTPLWLISKPQFHLLYPKPLLLHPLLHQWWMLWLSLDPPLWLLVYASQCFQSAPPTPSGQHLTAQQLVFSSWYPSPPWHSGLIYTCPDETDHKGSHSSCSHHDLQPYYWKKKKKPQQLLSCAWTETWNLFADGGSPGLDLFTVAVSLRQQGTGWCEHKREDTCPLWIIQSFTCCASYRRSLEKNPVI